MTPKPKIYKRNDAWVCVYQDMRGVGFGYFDTWYNALSWCSAALYGESMGGFKAVKI